MQNGLRKILGYTLFNKLGISEMTDKQTLVWTLQSNISTYSQQLDTAKKSYETALKKAIAENRERYRENDEKIKTTLRVVKNSGLGLLDMDYLIANITGGLTTPEIGVSVDRQNYDLATGNFWEILTETNNPTKHIEYIYRTANKILTGSPDGMVDGKLVWFSLEQAILNPDVAQKTDGEVKHMLKQW